jgi:hypothetical protein
MARIPNLTSETSERSWFIELFGDRLTDDGRLECPFCRQTTRPVRIDRASIGVPRLGESSDEQRVKYDLVKTVCAGCNRDILYVRCWVRLYHPGSFVGPDDRTEWLRQIHPIGRSAKEFSNTPEQLMKDYQAACRTIEISPEASACMSRRCLQNLLRGQGYTQTDLAPQIVALLKETDPNKVLPLAIRGVVDVVRGLGNFAAHPQSDIASLQIIPVEDGEADWCIEIIEQRVTHYFEELAALQNKVAAANAKFGSANKPPIKT